MNGSPQRGPNFPSHKPKPWSSERHADAQQKRAAHRPPDMRDAVERFLVKSEGRFVTATEIAREVYGAAGKSEVNAIQAIISRIRRGRPHLQVSRAMGYSAQRVEVEP